MSNQIFTLYTSNQLGHILQTSRKAKKMTQAALGVKLCLSQSRVSHLEQHAEELSFQQLSNWCAVLDLELMIGQRGAYPEIKLKTDW